MNNDGCDNMLTIMSFGNETGTGLSEIIYGMRSRELWRDKGMLNHKERTRKQRLT